MSGHGLAPARAGPWGAGQQMPLPRLPILMLNSHQPQALRWGNIQRICLIYRSAERLTAAQTAFGALDSVEDLIAHPRFGSRPLEVHGQTVRILAAPYVTEWDDEAFRPVPTIDEHGPLKVPCEPAVATFPILQRYACPVRRHSPTVLTAHEGTPRAHRASSTPEAAAPCRIHGLRTAMRAGPA